MTRSLSHDDVEVRIAEAIADAEQLSPADEAHAATCDSCAALVRALRRLGDDLDRGEPDQVRWRRWEDSLRTRLRTEAAPPPGARDRRRAARVALALAAALAIGVSLWSLRGDGTEEAFVAGAAPSLDPQAAESLLAAASADSLELGMRGLGIDEIEELPAETSLPLPDELPAPAWGDVLGELAEELAPWTEEEQRRLAAVLRQAT